MLTSRPARVAGTILGLVTIALFTAAVVRSAHRGNSVLSHQSVLSLVEALGAFALFHAGSIASLHLLGGVPAEQIWAASQLAKYLPAPGAAVAGMVHSSVLRGHSLRSAIALSARHAGVVLGGALVAGAPAAGWYGHHALAWPSWIGLIASAIVGLVIAYASVGKLGIPRRFLIAVVAALTWAALGWLLRLIFVPGTTHAYVVAAAFPAAWAVGFLALPVPAGLGVREAVLLLLLKPILGEPAALGYAILTRVVHLASDGLDAALFLGLGRLIRKR